MIFTTSLKKDLARRDFTINAMAADKDGNIIDPFGGITDYLLTGTGPANDFAKEQLLSAIEVLSSVSKLI